MSDRPPGSGETSPQRQRWRVPLSRLVPARGGYRGRSLTRWLVAPAVLLLAGVLFVTSATSSDGTDLRAGAYGDLDTLVNQESKQVELLRERASGLTDEVNALSEQVANLAVDKTQREATALEGPAGLAPASGPGVTVMLDDAPQEVAQTADIDADKLVVHQQDIQAAVNALWAGGAEAMTIQGQRVVSTTGIKCVGNTVVLHGVPYSPPYVISAVGDPSRLVASIAASPYISIYLQYVAAYDLGWSVDVRERLRLPGYDGSVELDYARPAEQQGS